MAGSILMTCSQPELVFMTFKYISIFMLIQRIADDITREVAEVDTTTTSVTPRTTISATPLELIDVSIYIYI